MPIHLPPLTRRRFIQATTAAGAAAVALSPAYGEDPDVDPHAFALLADTHVPTDPATAARGVVMADNLSRVVKQLISLDPRPAGALINGDCAYLKGLVGDYTLLGKLIEPARKAGLPLHLTMGNHDNRDLFYNVLLKQTPTKPPVAGKHLTIVETPRANFFLLDTLHKVNHTPGQLGYPQRHWLDNELDDRKDKPAIIVGHHNPQFEPTSKGTWFGLTDSRQMFDTLAQHKHVKAYVFGHSHRWSVGQHEGIHLINLPPVAYVFRKGDPNGYVHASLRAGGVVLELRCLDEKHPKHKQRVELTWRG